MGACAGDEHGRKLRVMSMAGEIPETLTVTDGLRAGQCAVREHQPKQPQDVARRQGEVRSLWRGKGERRRRDLGKVADGQCGH